MSGFKERLMEFVKLQYNEGQKAFEVRCGLSNGQINKMGNGTNTTTLLKIMEAAPELNLRWLLTGQGKMLRDEPGNEGNTVSLPLLPFSAVGGYLSENNGNGFMEELERCVIPDFTARGAQYLIRVEGDSMYPRYHNGELLAIKVIQDPTFFQWGKVYVLSTTQGCVVKRLFPDSNDESAIICHSENTSNYPDYKITQDDILGVAIVVGHVGIE